MQIRYSFENTSTYKMTRYILSYKNYMTIEKLIQKKNWDLISPFKLNKT